MISTLRNIIAGMVIVTIAVSAILLTYWSVFPNDIYEIRNNVNEQGQPCEPDRSHDDTSFYRGCGLKAYPAQVPSPGIVYYDADYCDVATGKASVEIILIHLETGQQVAKKEVPIKFVKGSCIKVPGAPFDIPSSILDGDYYLRFKTAAVVTPLHRTIRKETQSLKFHISPKDEDITFLSCDDFPTHTSAQKAFEDNPNRYGFLDGDGDNIACETKLLRPRFFASPSSTTQVVSSQTIPQPSAGVVEVRGRADVVVSDERSTPAPQPTPPTPSPTPRPTTEPTATPNPTPLLTPTPLVCILGICL